MSHAGLSKVSLTLTLIAATTMSGCSGGGGIPVWNPFAKPSSNTTLQQSGENEYIQPSVPQSEAVEASNWSAPFKKFGNTISAPFKKDDGLSKKSPPSSEGDPISLANKVSKPNAALYVSMAKIHERSGKLSEAVAEYDKALDIDEKDVSALLGLARLYDRLGRYDEAIVFYGRALKADPENAVVHNDFGLCLARSDNLKDAATALKQAVALDKQKVLYRNNLATVLIELNRADEAYTTLVAVHGAAVAHYNVGFLLNKQDKKAEALRHFQQAAALDPNLKEARQWVVALGGQSGPAATASLASAEAPKSRQLQSAVPERTELDRTAIAMATTGTPPDDAQSQSSSAAATRPVAPAQATASDQPTASAEIEPGLLGLPPRPSLTQSDAQPPRMSMPEKSAPSKSVESPLPTADDSSGPELRGNLQSRARPTPYVEDRYPVTSRPAATPTPAASVAAAAVPPSPGQISNLEAAGTETRATNTTKPAAKTAEATFPASRY